MKQFVQSAPTILLSCLLAAPALGAQILKVARNHKAIAISQDSRRPWKVRDYVCVEQAGTQVVCGTVLKVVKKAALVRLDSPSEMVMAGDPVRRGDSRRRPAALMESVDRPSSRGDGQPHHDVLGGVSAGTNFFFPMIEFSWSFSRHWAAGLRPLYFSSSDQGASVSAFAGMVSLDYFSKSYFSGLWVDLAIGLYSFAANTPASAFGPAVSESAKSLATSATVGYSYRHRSGFNAGLGAGVQYIGNPNLTTVDIKASGAQALVLFQAGYAF